MRRLIIVLFLVIPLCLVSACSFSSDLIESEQNNSDIYAKNRIIENPETPVTIEQGSNADLSNDKSASKETEYGIEIIWDIPEQPVEAYIIYSGEDKNNLDSELHLRSSDLKITDNNKYIYTILPIDPEKPIYVSIAAKVGDVVSEKSAAREYRSKPEFAAE